MAITKRKVTLSLDDQALAELERTGDETSSLSSLVNEAILEKVAWERQRSALLRIVAEFEAEFGEVDPELVAHYEQLMS